jgi:hypothetical protein
MEDTDIRNIWNNHSSNLQANLEVNFTSIKNSNFKSTRLQMSKLLFRRIAEGLVFLVIALLLLVFNIRNYTVPQYLISGVVLCLFSAVGAIGNIRQIVQIIRLDYSKPVTEFLIRLEKLRIYSLQTLKLLLLSVPFYFAYIVLGFKILFNYDIFSNTNSNWLLMNLFLSILFVPVAIYLYRQLRLSAKSNWVKKLIADNGGKQIDSAIQFINEVIDYRIQDPA